MTATAYRFRIQNASGSESVVISRPDIWNFPAFVGQMRKLAALGDTNWVFGSADLIEAGEADQIGTPQDLFDILQRWTRGE